MGSFLEMSARAAVEQDRTAFNLAVWDEVVANPDFAAMPYRFETDEHGQVILSPWESPVHGARTASISREFSCLLPMGRTSISCPISTRKGVKAADVAWCSPEIWRESEGKSCLLRAPEICVEILSPSNTRGEIEEKKQLYFDAGALEFWLCSEDGTMIFFTRDAPLTASLLCPDFPQKIE
jgi:Uma2 family endonuclease